MSTAHRLDKAKVEDFLEKQGWTRGPFSTWVAPIGASTAQMEQHWTDAILQGIVCEHEEKVKRHREFLDKHPTPKREA